MVRLLITLLAFALLAGPARAEHRPDHRVIQVGKPTIVVLNGILCTNPVVIESVVNAQLKARAEGRTARYINDLTVRMRAEHFKQGLCVSIRERAEIVVRTIHRVVLWDDGRKTAIVALYVKGYGERYAIFQDIDFVGEEAI